MSTSSIPRDVNADLNTTREASLLLTQAYDKLLDVGIWPGPAREMVVRTWSDFLDRGMSPEAAAEQTVEHVRPDYRRAQ
jgi:hypothetical protein